MLKIEQVLSTLLLTLNRRPLFKGERRPLHSLVVKSNQANLRWDSETKELSLVPSWSIAGVMPNLAKDEWFWFAMQSPVKFCRVVRRAVVGKNSFYLQLVLWRFMLRSRPAFLPAWRKLRTAPALTLARAISAGALKPKPVSSSSARMWIHRKG